MGCNWIGYLSYLVSHLSNKCPFSAIKCPHNECNKIVFKKDFDSHLSQCMFPEITIKAKCKYFNKEFPMANFSQHLIKCPEMIIECAEGCKRKFKRKNLEKHKNNICPEELIKCDFWDIGCTKLIKRKFLSDHNNLEKTNHLNLDKKFNEKKIIKKTKGIIYSGII